jgi:hypothetical protein
MFPFCSELEYKNISPSADTKLGHAMQGISYGLLHLLGKSTNRRAFKEANNKQLRKLNASKMFRFVPCPENDAYHEAPVDGCYVSFATRDKY